MNLFRRLEDFKLHSGKITTWKIECDALKKADWKTLAYMIASRTAFSKVVGVPKGGIPLANALKEYRLETDSSVTKRPFPTLIVDDVLTTGGSIEEAKAKIQQFEKISDEDIIGYVVFARDTPPDWVKPLFLLAEHGLFN